jgi:hypothetical protein
VILRACGYCGQKFDPESQWHKLHGLRLHCSHGCKYAVELPGSNHGASHVTTEAMPHMLVANTAHPADVIDEGSGGDEGASGDVFRAFAEAVRVIASLNQGDRDLVMYRISHPDSSLLRYAKSRRVSVQSMSARLKRVLRVHPVLRVAVLADRGESVDQAEQRGIL